MSYISDAVRQLVAEQAGYRCGYCLGEQRYILAPLEPDHVWPTALGGTDEIENLWLACRLCNTFKGMTTHEIDPVTGRRVRLFNPRKQNWKRHFWIDKDIVIVGRTAVGRATIVALQLNNQIALSVRENWFRVGWYPPQD